MGILPILARSNLQGKHTLSALLGFASFFAQGLKTLQLCNPTLLVKQPLQKPEGNIGLDITSIALCKPCVL